MTGLRFKATLPGVLVLLILLCLSRNLPAFLLLLAALGLHEYSHLLTSTLLGYPHGEVQLTSFGGQLKVNPLFSLNAESEWFIALSGPLVNWLMVGGVTYLNWLGLENDWLTLWRKINSLIGTINLIPALPLDGGRMVHAWLNQHFGMTRAAVASKLLALVITIVFIGLGAVSLAKRQGGSLFIIIAVVIGLHWFQIKAPAINLSWQLLQRKKQLLTKRGLLFTRQVLVTPGTLLKDALREYGTNDYLLFYLLGPERQLWLVTEEQAWKSLVEHGFNTTFLETIKAGFSVNLQKVNR